MNLIYDDFGDVKVCICCVQRKDAKYFRGKRGKICSQCYIDLYPETPKPVTEYKIWTNVISRCHDPNNNSYFRYGKKGISVCARWRFSFYNFYNDMGPRPGPEYSLDRYPNNQGNYEPGNCRWATMLQQQRNRTNNIKVKIGNKRITATEFAEMNDMKYTTIKDRISRGIQGEDLLKPIRTPKTYMFENKEYTLQQLSAKSGIPYRKLWQRIHVNNLSLEEALGDSDRRMSAFKKENTFKIWIGLKKRKIFDSEKGRVVDCGQLCDRWLSYSNFISDMGKQPTEKHFLFRKNPDRKYSLENCEWLTRYEAAFRDKQNVTVEYNGETISLLDLSIRFRIPFETIAHRFSKSNSTHDLVKESDAVKKYVYNGEEYTISQLALLSSLKRTTIVARLKLGWSVKEAVEIDTDGVYDPAKLRVLPEQYKIPGYKTNSKLIKVGGEITTLKELSIKTGINYATLQERIARGYVGEELTRPPSSRFFNTTLYEYEGKEYSVSELAKHVGMCPGKLRHRLVNMKLSVDKALVRESYVPSNKK